MIIRADRPESKFYILDKNISEDMRLTWAARGLLIFLLGKPDKWRVSIAHLQTLTKNTVKPTKRDGIYTILTELIKVGYVRRVQPVDAEGKFLECDYFVYEHPFTDTDKAEPDDETGEKPLTAKALPEKEQTNIVNSVLTEDLNEKNPVAEKPIAAKPIAANPPLVSNDLDLSIDVKEGMILSKEGAKPAPEKPKAEKKAKAKSPDKYNYENFETPAFVDREWWDKWMQARVIKKAAMTELALSGCLEDLESIREAGLNVFLAMKGAAENQWLRMGQWYIDKNTKPSQNYSNNQVNGLTHYPSKAEQRFNDNVKAIGSVVFPTKPAELSHDSQ